MASRHARAVPFAASTPGIRREAAPAGLGRDRCETDPSTATRLPEGRAKRRAKFVGACQGSRTLVPSPVPARQRFVTLLDLFASGNSLPSDLKTNRLDTLEAWSRHRSSSGTTTDAHADPAQLVSGRAALTARLRKKGGLVGQLRSLKPEARSLPRATCEAF